MTDFWEETIVEINKLLGDTDFENYSQFVPYIGDSEPSFPFTTIPDSTADSWMTLGNVSSGEEIDLRLLTYADKKAGGPRPIRKATVEISKALHTSEFSTDNITVVQMLKANQSLPTKIEDDPSTWVQYIDFEVMIEYLNN